MIFIPTDFGSLMLVRTEEDNVVFRSSLNPKNEQTAEPYIDEDEGICYLGQYKFGIEFLAKLFDAEADDN